MTSGPKWFETRAHLLLCQGQRCRERGAAPLFQALWQHLERDALAYYKGGGSLRLTESGCLGACSYGPTLCVYRQGKGGLEQAWYAPTDYPLAVAVAQAAHTGAPLPAERRYSPGIPENTGTP